MQIILYSKPGCHLCEGLQEKLLQIQGLNLQLEIRDITTRQDWFQAYQYEIPVLYAVSPTKSNAEPIITPLPRPSPRASIEQLKQMLQKNYPKDDSQ